MEVDGVDDKRERGRLVAVYLAFAGRRGPKP